MKNFKKYYLLFLALLLVGLIIAIRFSTKEDTWICDQGNWVKHGNPSSEKPTSGCGDSTSKTISNEANKFVNDDFEISIPTNWSKMENQIPGVTLMVVNDSEINDEENAKKINFQSYYAITYTTTEKSLNDYLPEYESEMKKAVSGITVANTNDGMVNNYPAKFLELNLSQQNVNFKTFVALIKGEGNDVWILAFNTTAKLWNTYETLIPEILNSFKLKK